jgi:hypothetical protein
MEFIFQFQMDFSIFRSLFEVVQFEFANLVFISEDFHFLSKVEFFVDFDIDELIDFVELMRKTFFESKFERDQNLVHHLKIA